MQPPAFERKLCSPDELVERVAQLPHPRVFTNGCFDILHRGHVTYLAEARAQPLEDRMALLASLESVSLVTWFDTDTPLDLILAVRPDVLVKGGDWTPNRIVGATDVAGWGGSVHSIPFQHHTSTTALIQRIRS